MSDGIHDSAYTTVVWAVTAGPKNEIDSLWYTMARAEQWRLGLERQNPAEQYFLQTFKINE